MLINKDAMKFLNKDEIENLNDFISAYRRGAYYYLPSNYKQLIGTDKAHAELNLKYLHKQIRNCIPSSPDSILSGSDIDRAFVDSADDTVALETVSCLNIQNILLGRNVAETDIRYIKSYFGESHVLSSGQNGVALVTNFDNSQTSFVIKAMKRFDDKSMTDQMNEYNIGTYAINKLRSEIPNFAFMFGAFSCSGPRYSDSKGTLKVLTMCVDTDDPVLYTIQERVTNSVQLSTFLQGCDRVDALNVLIQVFAAMYMAETRYSFTHNDLHGGNVLVCRRPEPIVIKYDLGDDEPLIIKTQYVAVIIDLGMSYAEVEIDGESVVFSPRNRESGFVVSDRPKFEGDIHKLGFGLWIDLTPPARSNIRSRAGDKTPYMKTSEYDKYTNHLDIVFEIIRLLNPGLEFEDAMVFIDVLYNNILPDHRPAGWAPYPYLSTEDVYTGKQVVQHLFDMFEDEIDFEIEEDQIGTMKVFGCANNQSCLNQIDANIKFTSPASQTMTLEGFMRVVKNRKVKTKDQIPLDLQQIAIDHHEEFLTGFAKEFNPHLQTIWDAVYNYEQTKIVTVSDANIKWYLLSPSRIDNLLSKLDSNIYLMDQIDRLKTRVEDITKFSYMFESFFDNNMPAYIADIKS